MKVVLLLTDYGVLQVNHAEAVQLLSSQEGEVTLEVVYVSPEDDDDDDASLFGDPYSFK